MKKLVSIFTLMTLLSMNAQVFAGEATGSVSTGAQTGVDGVVISVPAESPAAGNYTSTQSVSLSSAGSQYLCYTTNNATPSCNWASLGCGTGTKYSSAFSVASNTTVKAVSCYQNSQSSTVGQFTYTIGAGQETASEPANTAASTPSDSGGGAYTSTVTVSSATTVTGAADLSDAVTSGGADTGDTVTIAGNALTVESSSDAANEVVIPAGATITVAAGTWTGVINPPVSVSSESDATTALGETPTISVQMGDPNTKLDFGSTTASQPSVTVKLASTTCSASGYNIVRKSSGDAEYSSTGVSSITTTQSGADCLITFKTRYMSKFAVADNASSGGSSGGGGGGSSTPDTSTPYILSATETENSATLNRPLDLSKTNGVLTRPIQLENYSQKHLVNLEKGTTVTYENGSMFTGIITVPSNVARTERPGIPEDMELVKMISLGDKEGKSLKLSQPAKLTIYTTFATKVDSALVKVYVYNETKQSFEPIGGTLAEDQKSITVDVNHFSTYAVLYSNLSGEEITSETTTEEMVPETESETTSTGAFQFTDVQGYWAQEYIESLTQKGVFKDQANFRPSDGLLRAELVKILVEAFDIPLDGESTFSDVPNDSWYAKYVMAAKQAGIVNGYADGTFKPNQVVTRSEALKMILVAAGVKDASGETLFQDVKATDWFQPFVGFAVKNGIVKGRSAEIFAPAESVTRGEIAKMVTLTLSLEQ